MISMRYNTEARYAGPFVFGRVINFKTMIYTRGTRAPTKGYPL